MSPWTCWATMPDVSGEGMDADVSASAAGAAASHSGDVARRVPDCLDNEGVGVLAPAMDSFCDQVFKHHAHILPDPKFLKGCRSEISSPVKTTGDCRSVNRFPRYNRCFVGVETVQRGHVR